MDPYKILRLTQPATSDEIERAYRKQAKLWHPDVNHSHGAEARFKDIQLAHALLTGKAKPPKGLPPRPPAPTPPPRGNGEFYATRDAYDPWNRSSGFYPSPGGTEQAYRETWDAFFTTFDPSKGFRADGQNTRPQSPRDGHTKPDASAREQAVKSQQAEAILARGREQADGLKTQGVQKSEEILADALKTVNELKAGAVKKAQAIKDQAQAKADAERARIERDLEVARQQVEAIRLEFVNEMNRIDRESKAQAKAVRTHAENAAGTVMQQAANEALQARK